MNRRKQAGIKDPSVKISLGKQGTFQACVKELHYTSLKQARNQPYFILNTQLELYVKTTTGDASKPCRGENVWKKYSAESLFNYSFLDDDSMPCNQSEEKTATLFKCFSTVTILISCLGLFG